jgi:hypothetical protein
MNGRYSLPSKCFSTELLAGTLLGLALLGPACAQTSSGETSNAATSAMPPPSSVPANDLHELLSSLLTSQDRIALAGKLEASLRKGDLIGAEHDLDTVVELGIFAATLSEYLRSPNLLLALQDQGIRDAAGQAPAACSATESELQQTVEREQTYSSLIAKTLTDLMQENNALKTRLETGTSSQTATLLDIEQALQREQEQREATVRELANLRNDYRILQEARGQAPPLATPNTAELESRLQQEREKSDDTARQLAAMAQELRALQAFKNEAAAASARLAETDKALAHERMRNETLIQELTDIAEELRIAQEPYPPGAAPLVFRMTEKGMSAPLPQAGTVTEVLHLSALPRTEPTAADVTSAVPKGETSSVLVASLPTAAHPLPAVLQPVEAARADDRLVARADELLHKGDVSGARLLLERSLISGNARAALLMAETFDPNVLSRLRVLGIKGDAARAQEFYARARDLGVAEAQGRLEALK